MKLQGRPSPKMKSTYKEPMDEAAIAAWKFLLAVIIVIFFIWMLMQMPPSNPSQQVHRVPPRWGK